MWAVMVAKSWESFTVESWEGRYLLPTIQLAKPDESEPQWFIPVFSTREAAVAWADGNYDVAEIRITQGEVP